MSCPWCGADDQQMKYRDTPKLTVKTTIAPHGTPNPIPIGAIHEEKCKKCGWYSISKWDGKKWIYKTVNGRPDMNKYVIVQRHDYKGKRRKKSGSIC